jgi:hypothetical protein
MPQGPLQHVVSILKTIEGMDNPGINTAPAAVAASTSTATHTQGGVVAPIRDSMLAEFEDYLLQNMRASDVVRDEEGILLFNVNQVAYLVEGSTVNDEQRQTRKRIKKALPSLQYTNRRAPPANKGLYTN